LRDTNFEGGKEEKDLGGATFGDFGTALKILCRKGKGKKSPKPGRDEVSIRIFQKFGGEREGQEKDRAIHRIETWMRSESLNDVNLPCPREGRP